ncbi:hypothetical protein AMTRI_Chr01g132910 [Amborella trichopoda]
MGWDLLLASALALSLWSLVLNEATAGSREYDGGKLFPGKLSVSGCNLYEGTWNGRPDKLYLEYRCQPSACDLPRFNALDFLSKMKGKAIMFVGDSLGANQWQSLLCMIQTEMPNAKTSKVAKGSLYSCLFTDYRVNVSYYRSPYLVDIIQEPTGKALRLGSINDWKLWFGADVLWDYIRVDNTVYKDMNRTKAFFRGMSTWANWSNLNVDPLRTKSGDCYGQKEPISGSTYPGGPMPQMEVLERVIKGMTRPANLLNTSLLSQLRKDAHPSIYTSPKGKDCSHWFLAGLPDTWNQHFSILLISSLALD